MKDGSQGVGEQAGAAGTGDEAGVEAPAEVSGADGVEDAPSQAATEPASQDAPTPPGKRVWWWALGVVAALVAAYAGAAALLADRTPRHVTLAGVELGSLSKKVAIERVSALNATQQAKSLPVTYGQASGTLNLVDAGLAIDPVATVAQVTGFTLDPRVLWGKIAGSVGELTPVTTADTQKLNTLLATLAAALDTSPVDAAVSFTPAGTVSATPAVVGYRLEVAQAATTVSAHWLSAAQVELPATATQPELTQSELEQFLTTTATPLTSGPLTINVAAHKVVLEPAQLVKATIISTATGSFALTWDADLLHKLVMDADPTIGTEPQNARFEWQDGRPVIIPGVDGIGVSGQVLAGAVEAALATPERTVDVEASVVEPKVTTASLEALGIKERIVQFSTPLTAEPKRTRNIRVANGKLTGTIIQPGQTFSLLATIGPISAANGYISAGTLQGGLHIDGLGGGLSQIATQAFNAGWQAGFVDVAHRPHTVWFPRYPMGSESTVVVGSVDVKWTNDTPYAAMLNAYISQGRTWIEVWSTPHWQVETSNSGKYNIVGTTTVNKHGHPRCEPSPAGQPGFSVTEKRVKTAPDGKVVRDELFWRYQPDNRVVCTPPEAG